ncbi:hypothetical protein C8R45DRAFT_942566 [Mycena sanguinolenta]|nr:hypothetical protein C8R45DRAFT_942566 [Mycena sanguinolenta]
MSSTLRFKEKILAGPEVVSYEPITNLQAENCGQRSPVTTPSLIDMLNFRLTFGNPANILPRQVPKRQKLGIWPGRHAPANMRAKCRTHDRILAVEVAEARVVRMSSRSRETMKRLSRKRRLTNKETVFRPTRGSDIWHNITSISSIGLKSGFWGLCTVWGNFIFVTVVLSLSIMNAENIFDISDVAKAPPKPKKIMVYNDSGYFFSNGSSIASNFAVGDDGGITRSGNAEASDAEAEEEPADATAPVLGRGRRNRVPTRRYEGAVWDEH